VTLVNGSLGKEEEDGREKVGEGSSIK